VLDPEIAPTFGCPARPDVNEHIFANELADRESLPDAKGGRGIAAACGMPNSSETSRRSTAFLVFISRRLSHCDRTLGCTREGRCVTTIKNRPYFRPSTATRINLSVTLRKAGDGASAGARLCASSTTTNTGYLRSAPAGCSRAATHSDLAAARPSNAAAEA
jgi:hypothetical protein